MIDGPLTFPKVKEQLCQIASLTYNIEDLKAVRESLLNVNKELELRLNDQEKLLHRTNEEIKVTHGAYYNTLN